MEEEAQELASNKNCNVPFVTKETPIDTVSGVAKKCRMELMQILVAVGVRAK
ncbi:unnamed protein product, partial [Anisakis simplex]|uniref:Uncharacterized protein n=1 Tax=Anisakis simplex TaxID=6269 RepID=A0A0M3KBY2_ANISI